MKEIETLYTSRRIDMQTMLTIYREIQRSPSLRGWEGDELICTASKKKRDGGGTPIIEEQIGCNGYWSKYDRPNKSQGNYSQPEIKAIKLLLP